MDYFNYARRRSSVAHIGNTPLGGDYPIRIQSMANVSTMDTEASVAQAIRMIEAGAEYVRFTAQGEREARNLGVIRRLLNEKGFTTPLVADIHFNPRAADAAAEEVEKVRINPGNYVASASWNIRTRSMPPRSRRSVSVLSLSSRSVSAIIRRSVSVSITAPCPTGS